MEKIVMTSTTFARRNGTAQKKFARREIVGVEGELKRCKRTSPWTLKDEETGAVLIIKKDSQTKKLPTSRSLFVCRVVDEHRFDNHFFVEIIGVKKPQGKRVPQKARKKIVRKS